MQIGNYIAGQWQLADSDKTIPARASDLKGSGQQANYGRHRAGRLQLTAKKGNRDLKKAFVKQLLNFPVFQKR